MACCVRPMTCSTLPSMPRQRGGAAHATAVPRHWKVDKRDYSTFDGVTACQTARIPGVDRRNQEARQLVPHAGTRLTVGVTAPGNRASNNLGAANPALSGSPRPGERPPACPSSSTWQSLPVPSSKYLRHLLVLIRRLRRQLSPLSSLNAEPSHGLRVPRMGHAGMASTHSPTESTGSLSKGYKRASRKGAARRFMCDHPGCDKLYSRAEHLQRHQLNRQSLAALVPN